MNKSPSVPRSLPRNGDKLWPKFLGSGLAVVVAIVIPGTLMLGKHDARIDANATEISRVEQEMQRDLSNELTSIKEALEIHETHGREGLATIVSRLERIENLLMTGDD